MLKNQDKILPLAPGKYAKIAVIGKAADKAPVYSGDGSGRVTAAYVITTFWGIRDRLGFPRPDSSHPYTDCFNNMCLYYDDGSDQARASKLAKTVDLCIVNIATSSGEGSDRSNLMFGDNQEELVKAIGTANQNLIVVF